MACCRQAHVFISNTKFEEIVNCFAITCTASSAWLLTGHVRSDELPDLFFLVKAMCLALSAQSTQIPTGDDLE